VPAAHRNYKHFGALGVRTRTQGVDGVMAVVAINVGEMQVHTVVMVPTVPARAAVTAFKWSSAACGSAPAGEDTGQRPGLPRILQTGRDNRCALCSVASRCYSSGNLCRSNFDVLRRR
jgi:hypothetical protein